MAMTILLIILFMFLGYFTYHVFSVMCFDKPYTEKNDFADWSKSCYETGELYFGNSEPREFRAEKTEKHVPICVIRRDEV